MKVSVVGAGAIGSLFGGLIKHHVPDIDMLLIVRGDHGQVVSERSSIRLDGPWGSRDVPVSASLNIQDIADSDYVLFTVKSQATQEAISAAAPHLGNATVISIQNGLNDQTLLAHVDPARLVMAMTATNMAVLEPGSVSLQLDGPSVVGPFPDGSNREAAQNAAELLNKSGMQFIHHENIDGIRYNKLAQNAIGYASCLSASNFITECVCHRGWRTHVGRPIIDECTRAFELAGIELAKIQGRPDVSTIAKLLIMLNVPVLGSIIAFGAKLQYNKKPIIYSLQQDIRRGKKTEVEHINQEVVRVAESHGETAPYNAKVVELVHELEARGDGSFFTREEVIERFES